MNSELQELLSEAGMSRAELARRLEIHPNTVSNWGKDAPGYALAYLRLYVKAKELAEEFCKYL